MESLLVCLLLGCIFVCNPFWWDELQLLALQLGCVFLISFSFLCFVFRLVNAAGCSFKEPKNYRVHVVLLGFIILIMFMAVLHMHWLFLTSVVWVMNKTIILSCEQEIDEDSVSFFGSVFHLSILSVSMASPLSLITRMLFIVAPVFCLSLSLFSFLRQNMDYSVSCYLLFNHRMCCRFWALHIKINKPSLTVLLYKHVKSYHIGHFHVVSWPSFFLPLWSGMDEKKTHYQTHSYQKHD